MCVREHLHDDCVPIVINTIVSTLLLWRLHTLGNVYLMAIDGSMTIIIVIM